jgi:hypothetical protein
VNVLSRNYGKLFFLVLIAGLATGALMAKRNMQIDLGTFGGHKLALTTQPTAPTGPQIIGATGSTIAAPAASTPGTTAQRAQTPGAATAVPGAATTAPGAAFAGGQGVSRGTSGTVESVSGNSLTVKAQDGTTIKATVSATTTYAVNVAITASDIKAGDELTVIGQAAASGGSITATQVTVGSAALGASAGALGRTGAVAGQGGQGGQGATGGAGRTGGAGGQLGQAAFITGTVQKVGGNTLTVTGQDGTTSNVALAADTRLSKVTAGSLGDVKAGVQVTIVGQAGADGAIAAVSVQVTAAR